MYHNLEQYTTIAGFQLRSQSLKSYNAVYPLILDGFIQYFPMYPGIQISLGYNANLIVCSTDPSMFGKQNRMPVTVEPSITTPLK